MHVRTVMLNPQVKTVATKIFIVPTNLPSKSKIFARSCSDTLDIRTYTHTLSLFSFREEEERKWVDGVPSGLSQRLSDMVLVSLYCYTH